MKFSVLLSVYHGENPAYFEQSLKSILQQTLVPDEIVLVKDGPLTHELEKVIEHYKGLFPEMFNIVALDRNAGLGCSLRTGLEHCSYDIIARMDTDDICVPHRFERQIDVFKSEPAVDAVGGWIAEFEADPEQPVPDDLFASGKVAGSGGRFVHDKKPASGKGSFTIRKVPLSYEEIKVKARYRNPINHMTVMFRKNAVISAGSYQPFLWNEDYYLWVRMLMNGCKIVNLPEILVYVRAGESLYRRRGGIRYIGHEIRLQKEFFKMGFTSFFDFAFNICIRSAVRLLPNSMRGNLYKKLLRR